MTTWCSFLQISLRRSTIASFSWAAAVVSSTNAVYISLRNRSSLFSAGISPSRILRSFSHRRQPVAFRGVSLSL